MSQPKNTSKGSVVLALISLVVIIFTVAVLIYIGGKYFMFELPLIENAHAQQTKSEFFREMVDKLKKNDKILVLGAGGAGKSVISFVLNKCNNNKKFLFLSLSFWFLSLISDWPAYFFAIPLFFYKNLFLSIELISYLGALLHTK